MKAILIDGNRARHYADSAQQRNRQPWFVPDEGCKWVAVVCPAVRISRLGTHIAPKFAGRYYNEAAALCLFMPKDVSCDPMTADERYFMMDSAYCVGDFRPAGSADTVHVISADGREITFTMSDLDADRAVSGLSDFMTLKMGDLVIFGNRSMTVGLVENGRLDVALDGVLSVEWRIK